VDERFRPAILNCDILTFEIAGLPKSLAKCGKVGGRFRWRPRAHEPDPRHSLLLRACRTRLKDRRTADKRDELPSLQLIEFHSVLCQPGGLSRGD
jgi:hypothetical protein